jgi:1-acyl-sn-glycerol-3-phosphate acyltransferase
MAVIVTAGAPAPPGAVNGIKAPGVASGTAAPGVSSGTAAPGVSSGTATPGVAGGWLPRSTCDESCLPAPEDAPSVGPLRLTGRLAAVIVVLLASLGLVALAPALRPDVRDRLTRQWCRILLAALGVRLLVQAGARFGSPGVGVLVVADHVSWLDAVVLNAVQPCRMVAKREVRGWYLIGRLATANGTIFIDRDRLRTLPRTVAEIRAGLRAGSRVAVFPEGTTWCGRSRGPYRRAAFQAVLDAGAAVRPVGLRFSLPPGPTTAAAFVGSTSLWASLCRIAALRGLAVEVKPLPELAGADYPNRRAIATAARDAVGSAFAAGAQARLPLRDAIPVPEARMSNRYTLGPDVPDDEPVRDSKGNPIDAGYIERAVEEVHTALGRPSLSGGGESPRVTFRVSADVREAAERLAKREGITLTDLARQALEERIRRAS